MSENAYSEWRQSALGDTGDDHNLKAFALPATKDAGITAFVSNGHGIVDGTFYFNDGILMLPISPNDTDEARIDAIVLRKSWNNEIVRVKVIEGVEGQGLPQMSKERGVTWDCLVAYVIVIKDSGVSTMPVNF